MQKIMNFLRNNKHRVPSPVLKGYRKFRSFGRKKKLAYSTIAIIVLVFFVILPIVRAGNQAPLFENYTVAKGTIEQEVTATGKVRPAEGIDFSFESGGNVASVRVRVGDKIKSGTILATLKNNDYSSQVAQASAGVEAARSIVAQYQAQLDAQRARLDELKKGPRPEDIQLTQLKIDNAKISVADAESNLVNVATKAGADLEGLYSDGANSSVSAVSIALNSLNTLTDIQYAHFLSYDQEGSLIDTTKARAAQLLVGATPDSGRWLFTFLNSLYGGAKESAAVAQTNSDEANVTKALSDTYNALVATSSALNSVPVSDTLTASEKSMLALEKSNVNTQIALISAKLKSLSSQKVLSNNLVVAAQSQLNQARSSLSLAEQEMAIKIAGASDEQIRAQEAAVKQIEANMATQQAQIKSAQASLGAASAMYSKTVIRSPIAGTVAKVDVKVGEIAQMGKPVISVITDAKFKIEANIPEADTAKVKIGDSAKVTLDAYSSDVVFDATVVKIDLSETIIDGVSTYKTVFEFAAEDERIRTGMTANITISTARAEDVLVIPQRAVIRKDGQSMVLTSSDGETTQDIYIETGLVGSDGNVELVSGLSEGDQIISVDLRKKK